MDNIDTHNQDHLHNEKNMFIDYRKKFHHTRQSF